MNTTHTETWKLFKTNPYYRKTNVWIPDSPNALYQTSRWFISDHGNVKVETTVVTHEESNHIFSKIKNPGQVTVKYMPYYEKGGKNGKRYPCLPTGEYIHRLVAENFLENPENHQIVIHIDKDVKNNHVSNIAWSKYQTRPIL